MMKAKLDDAIDGRLAIKLDPETPEERLLLRAFSLQASPINALRITGWHDVGGSRGPGLGGLRIDHATTEKSPPSPLAPMPTGPSWDL
jgi:hypothetical protein